MRFRWLIGFCILACSFGCSSQTNKRAVPLDSSKTVVRLEPDNGREVLKFVKQFLPENPVIVEAGSCNGRDGARMAKCWPKGKVFAFEPVPELFEQVKKKAAKRPNMRCFQKALSDRNGSAVFYLSEFNGKAAGSSSLLSPKIHLERTPEISFPDVLEVETVTLDDWAKSEQVDRVDFFWLDMQGYELNMLKASQLALKASVIYTEVEFVEVYAKQYLYEDMKLWMEENGFYLAAADFDHEHVDQEIAQRRYWSNAVFVKKQL